MADIELRVVNESGELVAINLDGTADGKQVLRKEEIIALIESLQVSLGDYSFDGNTMLINSDTALTSGAGTLWLNISGHFNATRINGVGGLQIAQTNESIDAGDLSLAVTKSWTLAKFPTTADVDGKFGNYTFDGDEFKLNDLVAITGFNDYLDIGGEFLGVIFSTFTTSSIDNAPGKSAITKEWSLAKFFQQSQFINDYTGTSAQPILTDLTGKIASSLLPTQSAPQGNFTPTGGQEYPTLSGNVAGDYWIVNNVGAGYLFVGGDLVGETVYESAWMVLDVNLNWILSNNYAGTVQTAWGSIAGEWSDQIDNANAVNAKADQTDLDTTNSNVSSNTVAIGNKADQTALDTTNTNVATNADDIDANTIAIGLRATQADLDTTNTNVSTNASDITTLEGDVSTLGGTKLNDVTAGTNVAIDKTDPLNPVISASGGTGGDGNYITFSGTEGSTAEQNATALLSDLTTADELFIPKGTYNLGDAVIPEGKTLRFEQGAMFNVAGIMTGNFTQIKAEQNQIFTLTSNLQGSWNAPQAHVEWFGAKGDLTGTQDAAAIQKALDVFTSVLTYETDDLISYASSNRVCGLGYGYQIEQTITIPQFGNLLFGQNTLLVNGYNDMYDTLFYWTTDLVFFEGGNIRIRKYNDYASSPAGIDRTSPLAEREQYAYNTNPVFFSEMSQTTSPISWGTQLNNRMQSVFKNIDVRLHAGQYEDADRWTLLFDAFHLVQVLDEKATYFNRYDNIRVAMGNIALYIQGNPAGQGGMYNSMMFQGFFTDGCNQSIILGDRSSGNTFTGTVIQNTPYGRAESPPQVDIAGSLNYIDGIAWDFPDSNFVDGGIRLRSEAVGNTVNLSVQGNRLNEAFAQHDGLERNNDIGSHTPFFMSEDGTSYTRYWAKTGLGVIDNDTFNFDLLNRNNGQIEAIGSATIKTKPMFVASPQTNEGGGQSGDIKTRNFAYPTAYAVSPQRSDGLSYGGFGSQIGWYLNDEDATDAFQYFLGSVGFRQKQATNARDGSKGVYQIWRHVDGEDYNSMTIQDDGKIGINGVTRPSETIDLVGNTNNVSGAKNTGTSIKIDKVKLEPTDTSGALPSGTLGELRCGSDGSLLFHNGTAWQDVDLTPRP